MKRWAIDNTHLQRSAGSTTTQSPLPEVHRGKSESSPVGKREHNGTTTPSLSLVRATTSFMPFDCKARRYYLHRDNCLKLILCERGSASTSAATHDLAQHRPSTTPDTRDLAR